jgi:hypothetical protein
VPSELIMRLPRIEVVTDQQPLVSGSAHWSGQSWVIVLNARERRPRQRFALAHEFWKPREIARLFVVPLPLVRTRLSQCGLASTPERPNRPPRSAARCDREQPPQGAAK